MNQETKDDGKPQFSSIVVKKSEVERRLLKNQSYQNQLTEKTRLEQERQQKFSQWYEAKDTFKAVLKKLGMAKTLQETENLAIVIQQQKDMFNAMYEQMKIHITPIQEAQHAEEN